jgi:uncharacterized protein (DUF433 family)
MGTATPETQTPDVPTNPTGTVSADSDLIGVRDGHCGGKPHILGHRIKVKHVAVWHERMGLSLEEIVRQHPTISLDQAAAALAHYRDHRGEIEAEIAEEGRLCEELKAKQPSILEKIRQRTADATHDPLPPG